MEVTPGRTPTNGRGRKKSLVAAMALNDTPEMDNNDGMDKLRRHKDLMAEKKRNSFVTNGLSVDSSMESGLSNLSDSKLSELYATSLKLSAENKINNTNAFALPIIDVFARILKSPNFCPNFQMTSRSLDASAKVYSCRVDYVHAETFRIAGELAIGTKKRKKDDQSPTEDDNELTPLEKKRKKKDRKKSKTIETNPKNLDQVKQLEDLCILLIDPLFHQMSLLFSEEGVNGLIFNNSTQDKTCLVPIDSRQRIIRDSEANKEGTPISYQMDPEKMSAMCSKFASCFHIGFSMDDPNQLNLISSSKNQPMEAQEVLQNSLSQQQEPQSYVDDCGVDMASDMEEEGIEFKEPQAPAPVADEVVPVEMQESAASIMTSMLAAEPGEYSYLDDHLVSAWAGPDYWKYHPSLRPSQRQDDGSKSVRKEGAKKRMAVLQRDYNLRLDKKNHLSRTLVSMELARPTLQNWDRRKTTYPRDIRYKGSSLHRLGQKASLKLCLEDRTQGEENDATDYEDNIEDEEEDDMFNHQTGAADHPDSSDEERVPDSQPLFSQEPPLSQDPAENYDPNGVLNKFTLNYAKRAKRIDVKNLKQNMWKLLASDKPHIPDATVPDKMSKEMTFSQLYKELPSHITESNAQSLTVPLAFVCFLHMTNEKTLELQQQEDMADFTIRQG